MGSILRRPPRKPNPLTLYTRTTLEVSTVVPSRPISSTPNNISSHILALRFATADTEDGPSIPRYYPTHRSHWRRLMHEGWLRLFVQYAPRLKFHLVAGNGWLQPTRGYSKVLKRNGAQAAWTVCVVSLHPPSPSGGRHACHWTPDDLAPTSCTTFSPRFPQSSPVARRLLLTRLPPTKAAITVGDDHHARLSWSNLPRFANGKIEGGRTMEAYGT